MGKVRVAIVIGYCPRSGKILMGRRASCTKNGGLWDFFGGKVEEHEEPIQGAMREFKEETSLILNKQFLKFLGKVEGKKKVLYVYSMAIFHLTRLSLSREHSTYRWYLPENVNRKKINSNAKKGLQILLGE